MAAIDVYLQQILDAVYGEEVRGSIHDSIAAMNKESTNAEAAAISAQNSAKNSADTALIYMNNAESAADRAEAAAAEAKEHMKGGMRYKSSIIFADLPTDGMSVGDMYNIEDTFTADNRFKPEDRGKEFSPGTNVAWSENDLWDVVGSSVSGALIKDGSVLAEKLGIGTNVTIDGINSLANGYGSAASGNGSHAEGLNTQAIGNFSHAEGLRTIANQAYQHVTGKYNSNKTDTIFEVGNGTADNARSNAFEVFADGRINVNGQIYQNGSVLTFDDFKGSTTTANGKHGMVPAPQIGDEDKYLKGDGNWAELVIPDPIPTGGYAGQVLTKNSDTDKDASWSGGIYFFISEELADAAVAQGLVHENATIITPGGIGTAGSGGGGSFSVDSELSTSSTNPVQNAVITKELNKKATSDDLENKQDKLIAGDNITIGPDGKTISATGGGGSAEYPTGGLTGQTLVKKSDTDNDVEWGAGAYTFDTVAQMNAAIANGSIPNGSVIYVSEMSGSPAENLIDLTDVAISQVKDGEVLKWDAATESWVNGKAAAEIIVDDALSTTSTNPVQNKVIATELNKKASTTDLSNKQDKLTFDSTPTTNSTNPVTSGGIKIYAPFSFGVDENGNYGYIKDGADTVTPFKKSNFETLNTLPYNFYYGSAVVYENAIHILGGYLGSTLHYKWNGSSWTSVSTIPYDFYQGSAVVYNNEIHILGGINNNTKHYKWNGSSWTSVSTLPYTFYNGSAVVYENAIHILGGSGSNNNNTKHYKWDGSSWTSVSTLPYMFVSGSTVVYENAIHILGSGYIDRYTKHYKWNGSSWTSVSTIPYNFYNGSAVVYNNEIHILGGENYYILHYKWSNDEYEKLENIPTVCYNSSCVAYDDKIHILGGVVELARRLHVTYKE